MIKVKGTWGGIQNKSIELRLWQSGRLPGGSDILSEAWKISKKQSGVRGQGQTERALGLGKSMSEARR